MAESIKKGVLSIREPEYDLTTIDTSDMDQVTIQQQDEGLVWCQRHCKNPRKWQSKIPHFGLWAVSWLAAVLHSWVGDRGGEVQPERAV